MTRNWTIAPIMAALSAPLFFVGTASAQSSSPLPAHSPQHRGNATMSLNGWTRVEGRENSDYGTGRGSHPQTEYSRFLFGYSRQERGSHRIRGFVLQPQLDFRRIAGVQPATSNSTLTKGEIHQGYIDLGAGPLTYRLGRQELEYGSARLIGASGWTFCGRSFDAARALYTDGPWRADAFLGRLGQATNKVTNPLFGGIYASRQQNRQSATDLYVLYKGDNIAGNGIAVWTAGVRPKVTVGNVTTTFELAGQRGRYDRRPIGAYAGSGNVTYRFGGSADTRLSVECDFASGGNPDDRHRYGTFDQLFPNSHYFYGTADVVGWRNIKDLSMSVRSKVAGKALMTIEGHRFHLANSRDYWYSDNGAISKGVGGARLRDRSGRAGTDLGSEIDLYGSFPVQKQVTMQIGISRFLPGTFIRAVNSGNDHASNWVYAQTNYRF